MDDFDLAQQLAKSLSDAENNEQQELAAKLRQALQEVNDRLMADGWTYDGITDFSVSDSQVIDAP